ncbi:hypothetical protein JTE90_016705 [Oedothorax gibbosus]|uniref:Uncharacterized protein n=1 Tax=Oedothorax gibbosus TaxID=931172 RepID=A0AAV6V136_9ARAC|nr:hypothetical protein JTE90_016705 [Oedothorax gibbosus]
MRHPILLFRTHSKFHDSIESQTLQKSSFSHSEGTPLKKSPLGNKTHSTELPFVRNFYYTTMQQATDFRSSLSRPVTGAIYMKIGRPFVT